MRTIKIILLSMSFLLTLFIASVLVITHFENSMLNFFSIIVIVILWLLSFLILGKLEQQINNKQ